MSDAMVYMVYVVYVGQNIVSYTHSWMVDVWQC